MSYLRGTVARYQGASGGVYPNTVDQGAAATGDLVLLEENSGIVTSVPIISPGDYTYDGATWYVTTIDNNRFKIFEVVITLQFTLINPGDALFVFPPVLGLPFLFTGNIPGSTIRGFAFNAATDDAKGAELTFVPTGLLATQTMNINVHALTVAGTYTVTFNFTLLN